MSQALVCSRADAAPARPTFSLAGAGSVLIGFTAACIVAGTLIGWAVGSLGYGLVFGAVVGIPVGVAGTVIRYRNADADDRLPAWTEPRTAPPSLLPAIAGAIVVLLALPVFLVAGWPSSGWALGAVLWFGSEALGAVLDAAAEPEWVTSPPQAWWLSE